MTPAQAANMLPSCSPFMARKTASVPLLGVAAGSLDASSREGLLGFPDRSREGPVPVLAWQASSKKRLHVGEALRTPARTSEGSASELLKPSDLPKKRQPCTPLSEDLLLLSQHGLHGLWSTPRKSRQSPVAPESLSQAVGKMSQLRGNARIERRDRTMPSLPFFHDLPFAADGDLPVASSPASSTRCGSSNAGGNDSPQGRSLDKFGDDLDLDIEEIDDEEIAGTRCPSPEPDRRDEELRQRRLFVLNGGGPRPSSPTSGTRPNRGTSSSQMHLAVPSDLGLGSLTPGPRTPSARSSSNGQGPLLLTPSRGAASLAPSEVFGGAGTASLEGVGLPCVASNDVPARATTALEGCRSWPLRPLEAAVASGARAEATPAIAAAAGVDQVPWAPAAGAHRSLCRRSDSLPSLGSSHQEAPDPFDVTMTPSTKRKPLADAEGVPVGPRPVNFDGLRELLLPTRRCPRGEDKAGRRPRLAECGRQLVAW